MRFLHTMLRVGNLDRSIEFYTDVLGMKLLRRNDNEQYQYTLAFVGRVKPRLTSFAVRVYGDSTMVCG